MRGAPRQSFGRAGQPVGMEGRGVAAPGEQAEGSCHRRDPVPIRSRPRHGQVRPDYPDYPDVDASLSSAPSSPLSAASSCSRSSPSACEGVVRGTSRRLDAPGPPSPEDSGRRSPCLRRCLLTHGSSPSVAGVCYGRAVPGVPRRSRSPARPAPGSPQGGGPGGGDGLGSLAELLAVECAASLRDEIGYPGSEDSHSLPGHHTGEGRTPVVWCPPLSRHSRAAHSPSGNSPANAPASRSQGSASPRRPWRCRVRPSIRWA